MLNITMTNKWIEIVGACLLLTAGIVIGLPLAMLATAVLILATAIVLVACALSYAVFGAVRGIRAAMGRIGN